jgi:hypothetical protein
MPPRATICTSENPWCKQLDGPQADPESPITSELIAQLGACGVGCKGDIAEYLRNTGKCGLPGAIMSALVWQDVHEGQPSGFDVVKGRVKQILRGQVEPAAVITNPPLKLDPARRAH